MQLNGNQHQLQAQSTCQQQRSAPSRLSARPSANKRRCVIAQSQATDICIWPATRRSLLGAAVAVPLAAVAAKAPAALADDFTRTASGILYLDVREGNGASPQPGDTCVVHWSGYTKGYQVR